MRTAIIAFITFLVGTSLGGVLAIGFGARMGIAGGLVVGAQSGVCLIADLTASQGVADAPTLDKLIAAAIGKVRAENPPTPGQAEMTWVGDLAGCRALIGRSKMLEPRK